MKNDIWSDRPRTPSRDEPDVNHVFANFKNVGAPRRLSESDMRDRSRRRGDDPMRGVVVEVRRSRPAREDDYAPGPSFR